MRSNTRSRQRGFGALAIIIVLVVVGILVFVGWRVHSADDESRQKAASSATPVTETQLKESSSGSQLTEAKEKYTEVPELGIKIRLTDETRDLTVKVHSPTSAGFSLQSFNDATTSADTLRDNDGTSSCLSRVSVGLYKPEQRELLENDPIQAFKFDAEGKPLDGQWLLQLADKRYARFSTYQATCIKGGDGAEALQQRESEVKGILLNSLSANVLSME